MPRVALQRLPGTHFHSTNRARIISSRRLLADDNGARKPLPKLDFGVGRGKGFGRGKVKENVTTGPGISERPSVGRKVNRYPSVGGFAPTLLDRYTQVQQQQESQDKPTPEAAPQEQPASKRDHTFDPKAGPMFEISTGHVPLAELFERPVQQKKADVRVESRTSQAGSHTGDVEGEDTRAPSEAKDADSAEPEESEAPLPEGPPPRRHTPAGSGAGRGLGAYYSFLHEESPTPSAKSLKPPVNSAHQDAGRDLVVDLEAILTRQPAGFYAAESASPIRGQSRPTGSREPRSLRHQMVREGRYASQPDSEPEGLKDSLPIQRPYLPPGAFHRLPVRRTTRKMYNLQPQNLVTSRYLYEPPPADFRNYQPFHARTHLGNLGNPGTLAPTPVVNRGVASKVHAYVGGRYEDYQVSKEYVASLSQGCDAQTQTMLELMRKVLNQNRTYRMSEKKQMLRTVRGFTVEAKVPELKNFEYRWLHSKPGQRKKSTPG